MGIDAKVKNSLQFRFTDVLFKDVASGNITKIQRTTSQDIMLT